MSFACYFVVVSSLSLEICLDLTHILCRTFFLIPHSANNVCHCDGKRTEFEVNIFSSYEACCEFTWIKTSICVQFKSLQEDQCVETGSGTTPDGPSPPVTPPSPGDPSTPALVKCSSLDTKKKCFKAGHCQYDSKGRCFDKAFTTFDDSTNQDETPKPTPGPTPSPKFCPQGHTGYLALPGCHEYIYCSDGDETWKFQCSEGTLYDGTTCTWPQNVDCDSGHGHSSAGTNNDVQQSPVDKSTKPSGDMYYPLYQHSICVNDGRQYGGDTYKEVGDCCRNSWIKSYKTCMKHASGQKVVETEA